MTPAGDTGWDEMFRRHPRDRHISAGGRTRRRRDIMAECVTSLHVAVAMLGEER